MPDRSFHVFDTALGPCALVWSEAGVVGFRFPDLNAKVTERHLTAAFPGADRAASVPAWIEDAIARIRRHLAGDPQDLRQIPLDLSGVTPFRARVYEALRRVPPGTKTTYGALASAAGSPSGAARAVGAAMAHNPVGLLIPCHRVVSSTGKLTGFSAPGGVGTKARLLEIESTAGDAQMPLFGIHGDAQVDDRADDTSFDPRAFGGSVDEDASFNPRALEGRLGGSGEGGRASFDPATFDAPQGPSIQAQSDASDPQPQPLKPRSRSRSKGPGSPRRRRTATPAE